MSALVACENCEREATVDSDYCPHCGFLLGHGEKIFCDAHSQVAAIGVCIVCQRVLCNTCAEIIEGRIFCREHLDVIVEEDWAEVFQSTDVHAAELARSVLEAVNHHVQVRDFGSIGFAWDGGGDSALSRSQLGKPARVFVPISEFLDARRALIEWGSSEPN